MVKYMVLLVSHIYTIVYDTQSVCFCMVINEPTVINAGLSFFSHITVYLLLL